MNTINTNIRRMHLIDTREACYLAPEVLLREQQPVETEKQWLRTQ